VLVLSSPPAELPVSHYAIAETTAPGWQLESHQ
jgi:hypothetical protein